MTAADRSQRVKRIAASLGFRHCGIAPAAPIAHGDYLRMARRRPSRLDGLPLPSHRKPPRPRPAADGAQRNRRRTQLPPEAAAPTHRQRPARPHRDVRLGRRLSRRHPREARSPHRRTAPRNPRTLRRQALRRHLPPSSNANSPPPPTSAGSERTPSCCTTTSAPTSSSASC